MRHEVRLLLLIIFLVVIPVVTAGEYEENIREQIFLVRPDNSYIPDTTIPSYLENEDLIFFACLEDDNISMRLSVLCLDTNQFRDLESFGWGSENCVIGATNLESFKCQSALVQAEYTKDDENLKLTQEIRINKFSKTLERIVKSQFTDGGWDDELDTAHGIFVLSYYPKIFSQQIDRAIEYLKLNRDDEDKCWPKDECRISTTSNILFLLERSNITDDLRIQHDARLYLQKVQNYIGSDNWTVQIGDHLVNQNFTLNNSCVFDYNGTIKVINLSKYPVVNNFSIKPLYSAKIGVVCTEPAYVNLFNEYSEGMIYYQGDNFSYTILPACWSKNNENASCDVRSTLYALNTDISSSRKSAARSYADELVTSDRTAGKYVGPSDNIINDALYLMQTSKDNSDFVTHLLYEQNNNGSWNNDNPYYTYAPYEVSDEEYDAIKARIEDNISRMIITTSYAVMALLDESYTADDEPILDAQRFISLVEDKTSINYSDTSLQDESTAKAYANNISLVLNDTKRNALAFFVLSSNARPVLQSEPKILNMKPGVNTLDIINPTIFELDDLEYTLSDNLKNIIDLEEKDYIGAYSFRRLKLSFKDDESIPSAIGYLRISQGSDEYVKVPIIISTIPSLSISLPERITVFGNTAVLPFSVSRSNHSFACDISWDNEGISATNKFDISNINSTGTYNFPVRFADITTESAVYKANITCVTKDTTFIMPVATNILRFPGKPLSINPGALSIEDTNTYYVQVKNNIDQTLLVQLSLKDPDPRIELSSQSLTLYPGESVNVSVRVIPGDDINFSTTNNLLVSTLDIEERVIISIDIISEPPYKMPLWLMLSIIGVFLIIISISSYLIYANRKKLAEWYADHFSRKSVAEQITEKIQDVERDEMLTTLKNMIRLLKLQGLSDADMKKSLKDKGYTDDDIEAAITYKKEKPSEQNNS